MNLINLQANIVQYAQYKYGLKMIKGCLKYSKINNLSISVLFLIHYLLPPINKKKMIFLKK
jgi:hypothetical protein